MMQKIEKSKKSRAARGYRVYRGPRAHAWVPPLAVGGVFLALSAAVWVAAGQSAAVSLWLRQGALTVSALLSRLWGLLPVPAVEWLLVLFPLGLLTWLIVTLARRRFSALGRGLCRVFCGLCVCCFLFVSLFLVQHTAPALSTRMGLTVQPYSQSQLESLVADTVKQVNALADAAPRDENGHCAFGDFTQQAQAVEAAYAVLSRRYPCFFAPTTGLVKRSFLLGRGMSLVDLAGYYFPLTGEATVSSDVVDSHIPFDIAHEAAHARGLGPEDECNFAAYLVCMASDDVRLQYSGALNAYIYANNALHRVDAAASAAQYQSLCDAAKTDISVLNQSISRYDGVMTKLGDSVNDAFIKATGQPEGLGSYDQVVDLIYAYNLQNNE